MPSATRADQPDPRDNVQPRGAWQFDSEVTRVFDDMLGRSIPGYDDMRRLTAWLTAWAAPAGGRVLDVGCSRGRGIRDRHAPLPSRCAIHGRRLFRPDG